LAVLDGIFSKFTIGVYVSIGIVVLLITQRNAFTVGQTLSIIIFIIVFCFSIMCSVRMPLLIAHRFSDETMSELQVAHSEQLLRTEEQRTKWLDAWVVWSRHTLSIRLSRVAWIAFWAFEILFSLLAANNMQRPHTAQDQFSAGFSGGNETRWLRHPLCGIDLNGVDLMEMSAFAEASYDDADSLDRMMKSYFGDAWNTTLTLVDWPQSPSEGWWHSNVLHFRYNKSGRISHVVSIRGTLDDIDAMADVELWAASFVMNVLTMTVPLFSGYTQESIAFFGYTMNLPRYMFKNFSLIGGYVQRIWQYVNETVADERCDGEVMLAGHSLGGGLSKIIASIAGLQAFAVSGPGIAALQFFYPPVDPHIKNSFINIVPNLDPIAVIDRTYGTDLNIPCEEGLFACHDIWRSQCTMLALCGKLADKDDAPYRWCRDAFPDGVDDIVALAYPSNFTAK
jgi:lipase ATG15